MYRRALGTNLTSREGNYAGPQQLLAVATGGETVARRALRGRDRQARGSYWWARDVDSYCSGKVLRQVPPPSQLLSAKRRRAPWVQLLLRPPRVSFGAAGACAGATQTDETYEVQGALGDPQHL